MNGTNNFLRRGWMTYLLLVLTLTLSAQKHRIYVDDFTSEIPVPNRVLSTIRMAIIDGIRNTNRVELVDGVSAGSDLSLSPLNDARRFEAEYLLRGNLLQREASDDGTSQRRYHSRENSYKEKFVLRLDLMRTSDGVTISTRHFEETGSSSGRDATQYAALEHALINMPYEMNLYVENYFKVYGSILRLASASRSRAKTVYVNLGYTDPVKEGLRLEVIEHGMVEGLPTERKIGEVRIEEVLGPKISLCKVNKGREEIFEALQAGKTLQLISRQAKLFDE